MIDLQIDTKAVMELAANKVADSVLDDDETLNGLCRKEIERRIDKLFKERAEAQISAAIDAAISGALDREYFRVDTWGQKQGKGTTIRSELGKLVDTYWTTNVDPRTGKPTDNTYSAVTRAQFVMTQVCAEDFTDKMKQSAVSVTAALKDGFRKQLGAHVDSLLDELFRVKSLADQGKAEKPW